MDGLMTPTLAWLLLITVTSFAAFLFALRAGLFARFSHGFLLTVLTAMVGIGLLTAGLQWVVDSQFSHALVFNGLSNGMSATGGVVQAQIQDDVASIMNILSRLSQNLTVEEARKTPAGVRDQFTSLKTFHQLLMQLMVVDGGGHPVASLFPVQSPSPLPPDALASLRAGNPYISQPWLSPIFRRWFLTLAVPMWDAHGRFTGALVSDYDLQDLLRSIIVPAHFGKSGYSVLADAQGRILAHPQLGQIGTDISSLPAVRMGMKGQSGWLTGRGRKGHEWVYVYRPIKSPSTEGQHNWTLLIQTSPTEALAPIRALRREFLIGLTVFLIFSLLLALEVAVSTLKPLNRLLHFIRSVREGDIQHRLPIRGHDEVNQLAEALNEMTDALSERERMEQTMDEQRSQHARIESELAIARQTQMGLLPQAFNQPHHPREIDIHASLEPAREMSGDFYDLIFMENGQVCIVIGDVSGKGVPASLHMGITKSLIQATARPGHLDANEILRTVNRELSRDNEQMVFITVFLAILDPATGQLWYSNAGHNPPLLLRQDHRVELVSGRGVALGVDEDATYVQWETTLAPEECLVLYTDGVTEAFNPEEEMFDESGLKDAMAGMAGRSSQAAVQGIIEAVRIFANGAPQSDDLTLMALRYVGRQLAGASVPTEVAAASQS